MSSGQFPLCEEEVYRSRTQEVWLYRTLLILFGVEANVRGDAAIFLTYQATSFPLKCKKKRKDKKKVAAVYGSLVK